MFSCIFNVYKKNLNYENPPKYMFYISNVVLIVVLNSSLTVKGIYIEHLNGTSVSAIIRCF